MANRCVLRFHCNICCSPLTDAESIFTSCGHFFCTNGCTRIPAGSSGICEVCNSSCETGCLTGRGISYNDHVKLFVFGDPVEELTKVTEMIKFHQTHAQLFSKNIMKQRNKEQKLHEEAQRTLVAYKQLERELKRSLEQANDMKRQIHSLSGENQALRKEISNLRNHMQGSKIPHSSPRKQPVANFHPMSTNSQRNCGKQPESEPYSYRSVSSRLLSPGRVGLQKQTSPIYHPNLLPNQNNKIAFQNSKAQSDQLPSQRLPLFSRENSPVGFYRPSSTHQQIEYNKINQLMHKTRHTIPRPTMEDVNLRSNNRQSFVNDRATTFEKSLI